ncbi:RAI1 like PD-XK nuclease-domain-containing protein, partial [Fimicolochytrium jonesii]|uniref:RAI1 like PD-XK nuclease-domain-containing protein n=1 Tax=Fimicolochytrium jonesii TaxID=1396493 RepID=UPI0022FEF1B1
RGILTKILTTPYSTDAYELGITLYNHTIFIEEHDLRPPTAAYGSSERDKLMTYMGYKFESLATVDTPPGVLQGMGEGEREGVLARRDGGVVNTNRQYCCVVKTRVGRHGVVMGAEVDCLVDDVKPKTNPQTAYAELKTNRVITNPNQRRSFERHKLLKVWAQSFLPGIPTVIVGYRHDDGRLSHIQSLKTMSIPRMVRESASQSGRGGGGGHGEPPWDPTICLNFGNAFLDWVRGVVGVGFGDADVVYTVRCDYDDGDDGARRGGGYGRGGGRRRVVKLVKIERGVQGPTGVFIPQWYREGRRPGSDA